MAPPTAQQVDLIRRFEPILFLHPDERFFPSDAKRYLEHCALWKATDPFLTRADWGAGPVVDAGKLGAIDGEASVFLGKGLPTGPFDFLETSINEECFLEMTGWQPAGTPFPVADRHADLDRLAERYRSETALNDSQFWYHAEFFDVVRLRPLFDVVQEQGGHDFMTLFRVFGNLAAGLNIPSLVCYYLFFPGHDEGLAGCGGAAEAVAYANFAGEWACIAVLLDQSEDNGAYTPKFLGLTGRNIGQIVQQKEEVRVGMRVFSWDESLQKLGDHPYVTVAKGSHALYLPTETAQPLKPFTPQDDPARNSCGLTEPPATSLQFTEPTDTGEFMGAMFAKWTAGLALAGPWGLIAGVIWSYAEAADPPPGDPYTVTFAPPSPDPVTDTFSTNGEVVHPGGQLPPDVPSTRAHAWRSDNITLNNRRYEFTVDRETQILWPGDPAFKGFTGRWGPRVDKDQQTRRAGMRFPNFWRLFFDAFVTLDPSRKVVLLTSGTTWTVPSDWNNANNTIECIGAGGGGVAGSVGTVGAGGSGGGGAYSKFSNLPLTPGATIAYRVGTGGARAGAGATASSGGDSHFNGAGFAAASVGAKGGAGAKGTTGGAGGVADNGVGTTKVSGGNGAGGGAGKIGGPGGGGAAGPKGTGANGSPATTSQFGGGGGGGNGGGSGGATGAAGTTGNSGGNNAGGAGGGAAGVQFRPENPDAGQSAGYAGTGGGGGGGGGGSVAAGVAGGAGGAGGAGTDIDGTRGSGGGGGGGGGASASAGAASTGGKGGDGGLYGGGGGGGGGYVSSGAAGQGGKGGDGLIVISYTP